MRCQSTMNNVHIYSISFAIWSCFKLTSKTKFYSNNNFQHFLGTFYKQYILISANYKKLSPIDMLTSVGMEEYYYMIEEVTKQFCCILSIVILGYLF